jgi:hypothetical protein
VTYVQLRRALSEHRRRTLRDRFANDDGSVMPLAIGFTTIALMLILLAAVITDIYLAHRKLYALADSAALAAADSFEPAYGGEPAILFTDEAVADEAQEYLERVRPSTHYRTLRTAGRSPDGRSVEVTLRARYRPPLLSPFVPEGIGMTATARARGALREG